jgi:hypothetical protein
MHPTHTGPGRVSSIDALIARGMWIDFYDPDGSKFGLPTYPFHSAPKGLATIRQLRARKLRPGGQDIVAQILWKHKGKRRVAYLYRLDLARPKRTATPAQMVAIGKALAARRTCLTCGTTKDYYIARSLGECNDCADGGTQ